MTVVYFSSKKKTDKIFALICNLHSYTLQQQQSKRYKWKPIRCLNTLVRSKCCFLYSHSNISVNFSGIPVCMNIEHHLCSPRLIYGLISHFHHNNRQQYCAISQFSQFSKFLFLFFFLIIFALFRFSLFSINWCDCRLIVYFWYFVCVYSSSTDIVCVRERARCLIQITFMCP